MFGWIESLINGIGNAIGSSLSETWQSVSSVIWDRFLSWIYSMTYGAMADFFTLMSGIGAELFELEWVTAALKFFSLFGWGLFVAGLIVAIFDIAIEYQSMGRLNIKRQILPFLYGLLTVNLFTVVPVELFRFCVNLQNTFVKDITRNVIGIDLSIGSAVEAGLEMFRPGVSFFVNPLLSLLLLICMGYCVVKCFFANVK